MCAPFSFFSRPRRERASSVVELLILLHTRRCSPFPAAEENEIVYIPYKLVGNLHLFGFWINIMTTISVKLPHYGAISDFYELRYICALHQTGRELRKDGSIYGKVQLHMLSMMHSLKP
jgi:hypothetical protein